jgi:hypothetical protein
MQIKRFAWLATAFLLSACSNTSSYQNDPSLSCLDKEMFHYIRFFPYGLEETRSLTLYHLAGSNPESFARGAAGNKDFRPIGIKMASISGPRSPKPAEDPQYIPASGLNCTGPIRTKDIDFSTVFPPQGIFQYTIRYNIELSKQPGFPKDFCQVDKEHEAWAHKEAAEAKDCPKSVVRNGLFAPL